MQEVGDCGFFDWADNEMSTYVRENNNVTVEGRWRALLGGSYETRATDEYWTSKVQDTRGKYVAIQGGVVGN